jgi:hypothetical protein
MELVTSLKANYLQAKPISLKNYMIRSADTIILLYLILIASNKPTSQGVRAQMTTGTAATMYIVINLFRCNIWIVHPLVFQSVIVEEVVLACLKVVEVQDGG